MTHLMRILGTTLVPILLLTSASAQKAAPPNFDLKGESIGESIEAFKKVHPAARCFKTDRERVVQQGEDYCAMHKGVSFAGFPALVDDDCDQVEARIGDGHDCFEGLIARFRSGNLIELTYTVNPQGDMDVALKQVFSALTEKFGKPNVPQRAIWSNDKEVLVVSPFAHPPRREGGKYVNVVMILLATKDDPSKKDI
jgi:hypothetical protein